MDLKKDGIGTKISNITITSKIVLLTITLAKDLPKPAKPSLPFSPSIHEYAQLEALVLLPHDMIVIADKLQHLIPILSIESNRPLIVPHHMKRHHLDPLLPRDKIIQLLQQPPRKASTSQLIHNPQSHNINCIQGICQHSVEPEVVEVVAFRCQLEDYSPYKGFVGLLWRGRVELYLCHEELGLVREDFAVETFGVAEGKPLFLKLAKLLDVLCFTLTDNRFGKRLLTPQMICDMLMDLTGNWRHNPGGKGLRGNCYLLHLPSASKC